MDKKYKAISTIHAHEPETKYDSSTMEKRFVIMDTESGEIVDDAQGYGYRTAQKAYAGWAYKNRDKSKDKEKAEKERTIAAWMKDNKTFISLLDRVAFDIQTGRGDSEEKLDAGLVRDLLDQEGYRNLPFSASDLLRFWEKGPIYSRKKRR